MQYREGLEEGRQEGFEDGFQNAVDEIRQEKNHFIHAIQAVFDRTSPFAERYSNWLRSSDEPWRSLAGLFESP